MESKVIRVIEEQISVGFTGKVNILSTFNRQFLGHVLFISGEIIQVSFGLRSGLKAFYHLIIEEFSLNAFDYVVEPELVSEKDRKIHYPYSVIKNKMVDVLKKYKLSLRQRPPEDVKILISPDFLADGASVTPEEYDVMVTLTEWNVTSDIYRYCPLLDHEITWSLVSLRKKGALKILAPRQADPVG